MIHDQQPDWHGLTPRFYAYCACGVCGPPRTVREHAVADDKAHAEVCSTQGRAS